MSELVLYYSCSGHTKLIAECVARARQCDIREVELRVPYSTAGSYTRGLAHTYSGHLPKLKGAVDLSRYDTVYLGGPIWNYTVCPPLKSVLAEYDFSGKTVVPFCTDTGDCGDCFAKIAELAPGANVRKGRHFTHVDRKDVRAAQRNVGAWLGGRPAR